jgi:hypothetical protein
MSVLSFDVGIINLSYCLIKKENGLPTILDWGIINICENNTICNLCENRAIYYNINLNNHKCFYCKSHKPFLLDYNELETKDNKCIYTNKNDKLCNRILQQSLYSLLLLISHQRLLLMSLIYLRQ